MKLNLYKNVLLPCHTSPWLVLEGQVLGVGLGLVCQVLGLEAQVLGLGLQVKSLLTSLAVDRKWSAMGSGNLNAYETATTV